MRCGQDRPSGFCMLALLLVVSSCVGGGARRGKDDDTETSAPDVSEIADASDASEADVGPDDASEGEVATEVIDDVSGDGGDTDDALDIDDALDTDDALDGEATDGDGHDITDGDDATDITDGDAEIDDTAVVECERDEDCAGRAGANECRGWVCQQQTCLLHDINEGGGCSDGDLCTTDDRCVLGACVPGRALACSGGSADSCLVATCHPSSGCAVEPEEADVPCSNGTGVAPGTCVLGGFLPGDRCDGSGHCVDAPNPVAATTGAPLLEGRWFLVYTTFGRYDALASGRAIVDIDRARQTFGITQVEAYGGVPFADGNNGFICTSAAGGQVEVELAAGHLIGHQLGQDLAVLTDTASDGIALLVRADDADPATVDGHYAYFQTTVIFGESSPTTWRGAVDFDNGCLQGGNLLADPARAVDYFFITGAGGDCLTPSGGALADTFTLATNVRAGAGDPTVYPIHYRGAALVGGDVVLLVKEVDGVSGTPEYGVTLLVREAGPFTAAQLGGSWRYNLHAQIAGGPPRRDVGSVLWAVSGNITGGQLGTLDGTLVDSRGWFTVDVTGSRFSQKVVMPGFDLYQSGVLDPGGRFAVGWVVTAPTGGGTMPSSLSDVPSGGSMLLMLRP